MGTKNSSTSSMYSETMPNAAVLIVQLNQKKALCQDARHNAFFLMIIIANAVFEWAISFLLLLVHRQKKRSSVLYSGLSPLPDYLERVLAFPLLLAVWSPRSVLHLPSW